MMNNLTLDNYRYLGWEKIQDLIGEQTRIGFCQNISQPQERSDKDLLINDLKRLKTLALSLGIL